MNTIRPVLTSAEIRDRDRDHVWHPWTPLAVDRSALTAVRGEGYRIWDIDGNEYIDGTGGALSLSCGYSHPRLIAALNAQLKRIHHFDLSIASHDRVGELAERICSYLPSELEHVLFVNSGSEGVEAAVLMAASYWAHQGTPRNRFVTLKNGYHGSTLLSRSLSGLPRVSHGFTPPIPVAHVDLPLPAREMRNPTALPLLLTALDAAIGSDSNDLPAAVVIEPFLNVGGGVELPPGFLQALRTLCHDRGVLLLLDEVFTAYGRCGAMFACAIGDGIAADIVVSSKGLSSGYVPIAAVATTAEIRDSFAHDPAIGGIRYGHTMSGHALGCAVAIATLDVIDDEGLIQRSVLLGARLRTHLIGLVGPHIIDVRGIGLILVIEMASLEAAEALLDAARTEGVLLRPQGQVLMAVPALIIDEAGIDAIAERVARALESVERHLGTRPVARDR